MPIPIMVVHMCYTMGFAKAQPILQRLESNIFEEDTKVTNKRKKIIPGLLVNILYAAVGTKIKIQNSQSKILITPPPPSVWAVPPASEFFCAAGSTPA
jgi:hypothetical protein